MIIAHIENATRIMGQDQEGYVGLPVKDIVYPDGRKAMVSAWQPSPSDLTRLIRGESIYLVVMGTEHPPLTMVVGDTRDELG